MDNLSRANERHGLFRRALAVWCVLIGVEFIHGTLRTIFLVPVVGDFRSRQIGVLTGSGLILAVAYILVPWLHAAEKRALVLVGILWLVLTVAFEFSLGHFVFGRSWQGLASDYNILQGGLLPFGLLVLVFAPVIVT